MTYRFGDFELDEPARSLSLRRQPLNLQPKVFGLLAYLVRHAGRVVSKQELMEQLWPEVNVSEASLQRAVSLLRKTLREGDFEHALKSFTGHGYRFSLDQPDLSPLLPAAAPEAPAHARQARAAAAARDWPTVVEHLCACAAGELGASDYALWAFALECLGRPGEASPLLRQAVEQYEAAGERSAAAQCATTLAKIHLERAEPAVARGWLARARSLLGSDDLASETRGYLLWMQARFAAFEGRTEVALERAKQAFAAAEASGALPLRALTLGYVGFFNISLGHTRRGLEQQDHAAALAMSSAVDAVTGGLIYCNILWSCRCFADWSRGHQWADGFESWCKANFAGTRRAMCGNVEATSCCVASKLIANTRRPSAMLGDTPAVWTSAPIERSPSVASKAAGNSDAVMSPGTVATSQRARSSSASACSGSRCTSLNTKRCCGLASARATADLIPPAAPVMITASMCSPPRAVTASVTCSLHGGGIEQTSHERGLALECAAITCDPCNLTASDNHCAAL